MYNDQFPTAAFPIACECPADTYRDGACKHPVAVAIREPVLKNDVDDEDDCACSTLPSDYPCVACYVSGVKAWPDDVDPRD